MKCETCGGKEYCYRNKLNMIDRGTCMDNQFHDYWPEGTTQPKTESDDYFDKQLCRDEDTQNYDIIRIQNVLENAGVSDPATIEKIIKGLTWKK